MFGGPRVLLVSGITGGVGSLLLLVLNVRLRLEEEGVQGGRSLNSDCLGEVAAWAQSALEQILLHIVRRGDLDDFFVESLDVCSERFFFTLDYCL